MSEVLDNESVFGSKCSFSLPNPCQIERSSSNLQMTVCWAARWTRSQSSELRRPPSARFFTIPTADSSQRFRSGDLAGLSADFSSCFSALSCFLPEIVMHISCSGTLDAAALGPVRKVTHATLSDLQEENSRLRASQSLIYSVWPRSHSWS